MILGLAKKQKLTPDNLSAWIRNLPQLRKFSLAQENIYKVCLLVNVPGIRDWSKIIGEVGGWRSRDGDGWSVFEPFVRSGSFNFQLYTWGVDRLVFFNRNWHTFDSIDNRQVTPYGSTVRKLLKRSLKKYKSKSTGRDDNFVYSKSLTDWARSPRAEIFKILRLVDMLLFKNTK